MVMGSGGTENDDGEGVRAHYGFASATTAVLILSSGRLTREVSLGPVGAFIAAVIGEEAAELIALDQAGLRIDGYRLMPVGP
jgi:hypothetical protein